ncbi:hypothetical protein KI387_015701, partial [Taxus chinensis]
MGRTPSCSKQEDLNRGAWTAHEDMTLTNYIHTHGETGWRSLPKKAGLNRCGKSCRLRWLNYLRPDIKRGNISADEEELIIRMHRLLGNRWALIAGRLPGRTDNEIKNYWNTHLSKKLAMSNNTALISTTHMPLRKSYSFPGTKNPSSPSLNFSEEERAEPCALMRSASDSDVNSGVLPGMMETSIGGEEEPSLDVSKSWSQLLEDSLMAEESTILSSSELNVSYNPLHYFDPFPYAGFGNVEDFSVETLLLQPEPYGVEDICPLQNTHGNLAEQGIAETLHEGLHCAEEARQMELDPLDHLFSSQTNWEDGVDSSGLMKTTEEEYL